MLTGFSAHPFTLLDVNSHGYSRTAYTACKKQCYCKYTTQGYYPDQLYNVTVYMPYPACQKDNDKQCKDQ